MRHVNATRTRLETDTKLLVSKTLMLFENSPPARSRTGLTIIQSRREIYFRGKIYKNLSSHTFFSISSRLFELNLEDGDLSEIDAETFRHLSGLSLLGLKNNQLVVLRFLGFLTNLTRLDLSNNRIAIWSNSTFVGLSRWLFLGHNEFEFEFVSHCY